MTLPRPTSPANLLPSLTALVDALERGGMPWHEIGAAGEPAFAGTWVNFDAERKARFYKDPLGEVHLGGVIKSGTIGTTAFTLPVGYRPQPQYATVAQLSFAVDSNGAHGRVAVGANGQVVPDVGNNAFVFLDGITFRAV